MASSISPPDHDVPIGEAFFDEPDLPSDGRDEKGEAMIRDLPQRSELSDPPGKSGPTNTQP